MLILSYISEMSESNALGTIVSQCIQIWVSLFCDEISKLHAVPLNQTQSISGYGIEIEMLGIYRTGIREVSCLFVCKQKPKFSRENVFVKTAALLP